MFARTLLGAAALAALASPAPVRAQGREIDEIVTATEPKAADRGRWSLSTGLDLSTGHYGDVDSTEIVIVPVVLRYRPAPWLSLGLSTAWLRIEGPNLVLGPDNQPLPGFPVAKSARSGVGDLGVATTVSLPFGDDSPWSVDLDARVKLPTASRRRGLTTGKTDFTVGATVTYLAGNWAPYIEGSLDLPGDPAGIDLRNAPSASLGVIGVVGRGGVILSYDWDRALVRGSRDSHSLFAAYSRPVTRHFDLTGYVSPGLSSGAPAIEGGLLVTARF